MTDSCQISEGGNSGPSPGQGAAWEPTENWCGPVWRLGPFGACPGCPALSFPTPELPVWWRGRAEGGRERVI